MPPVLASYPFSTIDRVVDVGRAEMAASWSPSFRRAPWMKGMLFDLPHVAEKATRRIGNAGLAGRCEILAGDAFASVPGGGDAYGLSRMINGFDDARAVALLKNCQPGHDREG